MAEDELQAIRDRQAQELEDVRLYRISRFLEAYPLNGATSFTYAQAEQLVESGADYHLADRLAARGATPELAMRILL